ncbi:MAG: ABC transporter ATP-binding protein [Chloroflexia bacterium]
MSATDVSPALAVSVAGLSKAYRLYRRPSDRLRELLWPRRQRGKVFWALRDVSLAIPQGQVLGLIGPNGSGKSTLLQLIAGVLQPTSGAVAAHGRVTALLELGAGFNPEFTGRENIMLNATLLGLTEAEARAHTPEIIEFAGIGQFLDQPVKTYSSGMYVRLAFAIAVSVQPDILIVDEALAVGDAYFQQRCMRRMRQFRDEGKTIIFVSHDTAAVKALCDRAILLREGQIVDDGRPDEVVQH